MSARAMKFREYTKKALKTLQKDFSVMYLCLGMCAECGETGNWIKKQERDQVDHREEILDELGDTLWYLCLLSEKLSSSLDEIAARNIEKLRERYEDT